MKKILLYYKYVPLDNLEKLRKDHIRLCDRLKIKGRILLALEGINATVSGEIDAIETYKKEVLSNPYFSDIVFKESFAEEDVFKRLHVKIRDEIVSLKAGMQISTDDGGTYIEPKELKNMIDNREEVYIVDVRNSYESDIGKFKNSITLQMNTFRELPEAIAQIKHLKDKKIVTVCTGGIRCEKASAYLKQSGFSNVSQLHGGIVTYGNAYPHGDFQGKCYVFDSRIAIELNDEKYASVIGSCYYCHTACDTYINCCNAECNKQFVCCNNCTKLYEMSCCSECRNKSRYAPCLEEHMK